MGRWEAHGGCSSATHGLLVVTQSLCAREQGHVHVASCAQAVANSLSAGMRFFLFTAKVPCGHTINLTPRPSTTGRGLWACSADTGGYVCVVSGQFGALLLAPLGWHVGCGMAATWHTQPCGFL